LERAMGKTPLPLSDDTLLVTIRDTYTFLWPGAIDSMAVKAPVTGKDAWTLLS